MGATACAWPPACRTATGAQPRSSPACAITGFAPMLLDGAIDGPAFRAWVEQALAPTLEPGDIVVADNLSSHKIAAARNAIEGRGAVLLFLPAYSPDANAIEELFAKLKSVVRRLAPRSREALSDA